MESGDSHVGYRAASYISILRVQQNGRPTSKKADANYFNSYIKTALNVHHFIETNYDDSKCLGVFKPELLKLGYTSYNPLDSFQRDQGIKFLNKYSNDACDYLTNKIKEDKSIPSIE